MSTRFTVTLFFALVIAGCSSSQQAMRTQAPTPPPPPVEAVNFDTLSQPPQDWHQWDEDRTQFRGISANLLYQTTLKRLKPKQDVIVAVIDGGVDITHEDLKANIWTNTGEIPNNGTDDDSNGYIDDVHGWNFIGGADGRNVNEDTFEVTRLYAALAPRFANADTTNLSAAQQNDFARWKKVQDEYEYQINDKLEQYRNIRSLEQSRNEADAILTDYFGRSYSPQQVQNLQPSSQELAFAQNVMSYVLENDIDSTLIADQKEQLYSFMKYGYNPDFTTRDIVGDDYANKNERYYGNNDVAGPDPSHGTHVAGIIGAVRDNNLGMNGVAKGVKLMPVRAVPDGDERDKDVANAIRYAVDNGAHIINMSFGKSYSPDKAVVDKAIRYANSKGVLMVHAAGNSSENTDQEVNYPTDTYGDYFTGGNHADLWLSVGASSWQPDSSFVGSFSNYGNARVDLFAPGVDIYSTVPGNNYQRNQGTSMAAPVVSGTAALLMQYFPDLSAAQIRDLIMRSVTKYPNQMVFQPATGNTEPTVVPFAELSSSDGEVNVYRAFQLALEQYGDQ